MSDFYFSLDSSYLEYVEINVLNELKTFTLTVSGENIKVNPNLFACISDKIFQILQMKQSNF
jgi:hypothetical protein